MGPGGEHSEYRKYEEKWGIFKKLIWQSARWHRIKVHHRSADRVVHPRHHIRKNFPPAIVGTGRSLPQAKVEIEILLLAPRTTRALNHDRHPIGNHQPIRILRTFFDQPLSGELLSSELDDLSDYTHLGSSGHSNHSSISDTTEEIGLHVGKVY